MEKGTGFLQNGKAKVMTTGICRVVGTSSCILNDLDGWFMPEFLSQKPSSLCVCCVWGGASEV